MSGPRGIAVKNGDGSVPDVATSGTPHPLEIGKSQVLGGKNDFDMWGSAGPVTAPSAASLTSELIGGSASPTR